MPASASDVLRFRLASQLIASAQDLPLDGVVHRLTAVQAQDFGQAVWALGVRAPGTTRADVDAMLDSGRVIRSWPMRGTLHFVEAADIRWMLRLTAERMLATAAKRHRDLGLDAGIFRRAAELMTGALSDGRRLGRADALQALERGGVATDGQRGSHLIGYLAQTAVICWGPPLGTQQALVLLDEWAPELDPPDHEESLRRFALRYFTGHGPATLKDFLWWSKLTVAQAKIGLDLAQSALVELTHDGTAYWMAPDVTDAVPTRTSSAVHALPGFDEYLLGYQNRSHSLDIGHALRVVPGGNGIFLPMIVSRGRVVGTWRRSMQANRVTITGMPFESLGAREVSDFEREAARYGRFLDLPTTVRWD